MGARPTPEKVNKELIHQVRWIVYPGRPLHQIRLAKRHAVTIPRLHGVGSLVRSVFCSTLLTIAVGLTPVFAQTKDGLPPGADHVTFHLGIPEQVSLVETRTVRKYVDFADNKPAEEQTMSCTSDVVIRRRGSGFVVSVRPHPMREWETPRGAAQGLATALRSMRLQYEFNGQGNLVALRGIETAREELASALPSGMQPFLDKLFPAMVKEMEEEWSSRYGPLVGATYPVGYFQRGEAPIAPAPWLPPVTARFERGVSRREPCNGGHCVVLLMGYVVDNPAGLGESMMGMLRDWLRQILAELGGTRAQSAIREMETAMPTVKVTYVLVAVERLVDPKTMTVYYEKKTKFIKFQIDRSNEMNWKELTSIKFKRAD